VPPWLPYRLPRGRLRVTRPWEDLPPWLPYRLPRGRLRRRPHTSRARPWLPYRLPRGRLIVKFSHANREPWLPYRLPRGRLTVGCWCTVVSPWLPYRLPRGRLRAVSAASIEGPWLPYRLPPRHPLHAARGVTPCRQPRSSFHEEPEAGKLHIRDCGRCQRDGDGHRGGVGRDPGRMIGGIEERSASFEARSAPRSHPTEE
jgi:hypothetical protein